MNKVLTLILIFFFISGIFTTSFSSVSASSELVENTWTTETPMSQPRSDLGVVAVDGKIYAIGGRTDTDFTGTNECYSPATDTWVTLKSMPTPRGDFIIVSCQGKIYCIGGVYGAIFPLSIQDLRSLDVVEVYDPVNDVWESKKSLPVHVENDVPAQVVNGQIFIMVPNGALYIYNPLADKWSTKSSLPGKEEPLQTLVVNEQFFVITQSALYMYNPATGKWLNKTSLPNSMSYAFSGVMDNQIVIGDFLLTQSTETLWSGLFNAQLRVRLYDPASDVWYEGKITDEHIFATNPIFNAATLGVTSGVYAPKSVYVLGIEAAKDDLKTVKPFTWRYDPIGDVWSTAKTVDTAPYIRGCKTVIVNDVFYIIGNIFAEQYVPNGYSATPLSSEPAAPLPSEPALSEPFFAKFVVVAIVLITGVIAATYIVFYIRRKKGTRGILCE